jgi:hypothetical protein
VGSLPKDSASRWRAKRSPRTAPDDPPDPFSLWDDLAALWSRALILASDSAVPWPVRGRVASFCRALAFEVAEDNGYALRAVEAANACLECFPLVHDLLIAAREVAVDSSTLLEPMLALCRQAHDAGRHDAVVVALLELLELESFRADVPAAWLVASIQVDGEADYWLHRLVRRWIELFGAQHEGIRAIVRDRADVWFPTRRFRLDALRAMHAAEPTAAGWVALASRRDEMDNGPLGLSFGSQQGGAVAALREALLRKVPAATHVVLEGWLEELST